jgi:hypothetical protein
MASSLEPHFSGQKWADKAFWTQIFDRFSLVFSIAWLGPTPDGLGFLSLYQWVEAWVGVAIRVMVGGAQRR